MLGLLSSLLRGTILDDSDVAYRVDYTNEPGADNIAGGEQALDGKLAETSGEIVVCGYAQGCEVADRWLTKRGPSSPLDSERLSFLMLGNPGHRYGGLLTGRAEFDALAWTGGRPRDSRFAVTELARQYDGLADVPTVSKFQAAVASVGAATADSSVWVDTLRRVAALMGDQRVWTAATNAVAGMALVHEAYFDVAPGDAKNVKLVEGSTTFVWSPTYPVPMLGAGAAWPGEDKRFRTLIESCYERPADIPMPDYPHTSWLNTRVPWRKPAVTGWWAEFGAAVAVGAAHGSGVVLPAVVASTVHIVAAAAHGAGEAPAAAVSAGGSVSLSLSVARGRGSVLPAAVSAGSVISAGAATGMGAVPAVSVSAGVLVSAAFARGGGTTPAGVVVAGVGVTVSVSAAHGAGSAPDMAAVGGTGVVVAAGAAHGAGGAPVALLAYGVAVAAAAARGAGSGLPVSVFAGGSVQVAAGVARGAGSAPDVAVSTGVALPVGVAAGSGVAPAAVAAFGVTVTNGFARGSGLVPPAVVSIITGVYPSDGVYPSELLYPSAGVAR